jgi:Homeodomain-like domain
MSLHNADLGDPVPNESGDRRKQIVNLYGIGKLPPEIAAILGVSRSRVNQILKEETAAHIKSVGTDGMRVELATDLELLKEHLIPLCFPVNDEGEPVAPDKDTVSLLLKTVKQLGDVMGMGSAGPVYADGNLRGFLNGQGEIATYNQATRKSRDGKK